MLSSSVYAIDRARGVVTGIAENTSAASLTADFDNDVSRIKVYGHDNSVYTGTAVSTGMKIRLFADGLQKDELKSVVRGDTSGDGRINITDYSLIRLHILSRNMLQNEYVLAGDIDLDGRITVTDYTLVRLHILGLKPILPGTLPLAGLVIGLDPGHQRYANNALEPVAPGSKTMKKKVSSGTQGRFTRVPEYIVVLKVGLKLKNKLEELGATVIMTRETHDVDISNSERAIMMNKANVDCWLRIHADGNDDPKIYGMSMLVPAKGCMNTADPSVQKKSTAIGQVLLDCVAKEAGAKNLGLKPRSDQTGFNWSSVPVCNIEMGYMTNETEDRLLITGAYQDKIVAGLVKGFVQYYS
jgi:N-acetylmuramoyl-L-alanine amidase